MLRFVGQRVLLAIFPFYLLCPLMNMENLIGFGIMAMSVLCKRLAAVCKSDTIHCSPLQYTEFQQKPHCPTSPSQGDTFKHPQTDNIQYRSLSFLTLSGK